MKDEKYKNNKGLVSKISSYKSSIALTIGFTLEIHMAYQYVYLNQCKHTALTGVEKFAGLVLLAYGIYHVMNLNKK